MIKPIYCLLIVSTTVTINYCKSVPKDSKDSPSKIESKELPNPAGEKNPIRNEKNEFVKANDQEIPFLTRESKEPLEFFRVYFSSDEYKVWQIRGTDSIERKPDPGGDELIMSEVKRFNLIDFIDDGIVMLKLNPDTGKLENFNFHTRVPRINDMAKIIQNDATRWTFVHPKNGQAVNTKFLIYYQISLRKNTTSREDVKQRLMKELRKNK